MSRKTILFILAMAETAIIALGDNIGVTVDKAQIAVVLGTFATFIFGSSKVDKVRIKRGKVDPYQVAKKWLKPEFIFAALTILSPFIQKIFGWNIPTEYIATIVPGLLTAIFGAQYRKAAK